MYDRDVSRKAAFGTVSEALGLVFAYPVLLGAFVAVEAVDAAVPADVVGRSIPVWLLALFVGGVAYVYTEAAVGGGRASVLDASGRVLRRLLSLIGVSIVYGVVVAIGLVLLIAPGVYLGARLVLAFPACVLDDQSAFDSLETSWNVADGNVLKLVGIFLLLFLPVALGVAAVELSQFEFGYAGNYLLLVGDVGASAVLTATLEVATARVYLENRSSYVSGGPGGHEAGRGESSRDRDEAGSPTRAATEMPSGPR